MERAARDAASDHVAVRSRPARRLLRRELLPQLSGQGEERGVGLLASGVRQYDHREVALRIDPDVREVLAVRAAVIHERIRGPRQAELAPAERVAPAARRARRGVLVL